MKEKLELYIKENHNQVFVSFKKVKANMDRACCMSADLLQEGAYKDYSTVDEFISENKDETKFQQLLFKLIDERNLKDSDVYNKINMDRRLFSKIRNNSNYHPSKETVILLGIGLELDEDEMIELLESASYSLPKNDIFNLIIRFCCIEKIYDINTINEFLYDHKCKLIGLS